EAVGPVEDLAGHDEARFGRLGDAVVVHAQPDHGGIVLLDDGQHRAKRALLAVDGVHQRLAVVSTQRRGERLGVRSVDAQRHVRHGHHFAHDLLEQLRLIRAGYAGVHVEDGGARLDLGDSILAHDVEVARLERGLELLAPRRVDALADDDGWPLAADLDRFILRADDGCQVVLHASPHWNRTVAVSVARPACGGLPQARAGSTLRALRFFSQPVSWYQAKARPPGEKIMTTISSSP